MPRASSNLILTFPRNVSEALRSQSISSGILDNSAYIVTAGPANTCGHYVTIREEYSIPMREPPRSLGPYFADIVMGLPTFDDPPPEQTSAAILLQVCTLQFAPCSCTACRLQYAHTHPTLPQTTVFGAPRSFPLTEHQAQLHVAPQALAARLSHPRSSRLRMGSRSRCALARLHSLHSPLSRACARPQRPKRKSSKSTNKLVNNPAAANS